MKLLLILLFPLFSNGQSKWFVPNKKEIISYVSFAVSGAGFGINQAVYHHQYGKGNDYIDIKTSWKNKYKDWDAGDKRPAFFGSKTILVWTTDLAHLSATLDKTFLVTGIVLNTWDLKKDLKKYNKKDRWKVIALKKILFPLVIRSIVFETTFKKL